jgi:3-dehydroquinate synthetase
MAKMMGDKKNTEGKLKCVLLDRIGHCYEPKARCVSTNDVCVCVCVCGWVIVCVSVCVSVCVCV